MAGQRPDDAELADDPAGRIIDDKTAEARERIGRIESATETPSAAVQNAAEEIEDETPEREAKPAAVNEREFEKSLKELEAASRDLKARIDEERRRDDMPLDSALGDPDFERRSADGRNDLPDRDDE